jgi:hypothetical protein
MRNPTHPHAIIERLFSARGLCRKDISEYRIISSVQLSAGDTHEKLEVEEDSEVDL